MRILQLTTTLAVVVLMCPACQTSKDKKDGQVPIAPAGVTPGDPSQVMGNCIETDTSKQGLVLCVENDDKVDAPLLKSTCELVRGRWSAGSCDLTQFAAKCRDSALVKSDGATKKVIYNYYYQSGSSTACLGQKQAVVGAKVVPGAVPADTQPPAATARSLKSQIESLKANYCTLTVNADFSDLKTKATLSAGVNYLVTGFNPDPSVSLVDDSNSLVKVAITADLVANISCRYQPTPPAGTYAFYADTPVFPAANVDSKPACTIPAGTLAPNLQLSDPIGIFGRSRLSYSDSSMTCNGFGLPQVILVYPKS